MKIIALIPLVLLLAAPCRAESILGGLETLGESLNRLNSDILDRLNGDTGSDYQEQIRRYQMLEAARVHEMSEVTGVDPDVIRRLRAEGSTWQDIADMYDVNLENLPDPRIMSD
ncbi:MAG: hypothetical protein K2H64_07050 [Desulfovibrio sp.]|nr:hypothetical protein [Desulfovibrio sp.]